MNMPSFFARVASPLRERQLQQTLQKYAVFNTVVAVYAAVVLLFQTLFLISPVMTLVTKTPLYDIQTYLGILGGVLVLVDLFTTKIIWRGANCLLLYAICILAAIASLRMLSYGVKENLFKLCWMTIQFTLIYSCAYRLTKEQLHRGLACLYAVITAIWIAACCVSLYQFVRQIEYMEVINPLAKDISATRQGFYDNRLFGIFYTLNHAAYVSLYLFLIGIVYVIFSKRIVIKLVLVLSESILLSHIILSGSRSAKVAMLACLFCLFGLLLRNIIRFSGWRKTVLLIVCVAALTAASLFAFQKIKNQLSHIPAAYKQLTGDGQHAGELVPADQLLNRDNLKNDTSNGRLNIWGDYLSLYKEVGAVGLSPGYYMSYVLENHPDLYIVDHIKRYYPDKYNSGIVYHVHSGYLMVYVSAGILGALLLLVFCCLCIGRVFYAIIRRDKLSRTFICAFVIVGAGAVSALFDEGLFFQNTPHTTMFWMALGVLMKEAKDALPEKKPLPT